MHAVTWFPFGPGLLPFLFQWVQFLLWNTKSINNKSVIWSINSGHVAPTDSTTLLSALGVKSAATTQSMPTRPQNVSQMSYAPIRMIQIKRMECNGGEKRSVWGHNTFLPFQWLHNKFFWAFCCRHLLSCTSHSMPLLLLSNLNFVLCPTLNFLSL